MFVINLRKVARTMFRLASLILRNALRNRRRSLLTLGSTTVSLALLTLLVAIYQGFFYGEDRSPSEAQRLVVRHKVSLTQPLPSSYMEDIRQVDHVKELSGYSWFQGVYIDQQHFFARFAVDAKSIFDIYQDWHMPADQLEQFKREQTACAIAKKIADDYKIKVGDTVTIVGDIYPVTLELKVAGIFTHPPNAECLVFHREYLRELLPPTSAMRDMVGTYIVLADSVDSVPLVAKKIDTLKENTPYPTHSESEKEFGRSFLAFLGNLRVFLAAICAAVTFTILLVSSNTVAMSVRERTREMAILRTLGYRPGEILQMVIGEAVFISLLGGLLGLGLGTLMTKGAATVVGNFGITGVKWQGALIVLAMAVVVGMVASLVPAIITARKNVVESLRFVG